VVHASQSIRSLANSLATHKPTTKKQSSRRSNPLPPPHHPLLTTNLASLLSYLFVPRDYFKLNFRLNGTTSGRFFSRNLFDTNLYTILRTHTQHYVHPHKPLYTHTEPLDFVASFEAVDAVSQWGNQNFSQGEGARKSSRV